MNCPLNPKIFEFEISETEALGLNEKDFSNVKVRLFKPDGTESSDDPNIMYIATGKLGMLRGGLLNVKDHRPIMSKEDIVAMADSAMEEKLLKKRTEQKWITPAFYV